MRQKERVREKTRDSKVHMRMREIGRAKRKWEGEKK